MLGYWKRIVKRHQLLDQFVFRSEFVSSRWDSVAQQHTIVFRNVETDETFEVVADVLIAATGALNKEIIPDVPGRDKFKGVQWHSSRWRNDVDLRGKRLAVCGSGSSGIQCVLLFMLRSSSSDGSLICPRARRVIPNIVDIEGIEIVQFIRSPGYYRPKHNFEYSRLQRLLFKVPGVLRLYRWKLFIEHDRNILSRGSGTWASAMRERMAKVRPRLLSSQVPLAL